MTVARPTTFEDALGALENLPDAQLLAGGTDFMVEVNFGHRRPRDVVTLRRVDELRGWTTADGKFSLGSGLTYRTMEDELTSELPALAAAARTVGSPPIRNAGTLGGNVATASPAGDTLPVLIALDAEIDLVGPQGERSVPISEFITGVKQTDRQSGEIVRSVRVPRVDGPQEFCKVGTRNAMVISIACLALVLDVGARRVRCGLGSVSPIPLRATEAENFASEALDWSSLQASDDILRRFGELAAEACSPISDHRGTAEYRSHTVSVMARRALRRTLTQ